MTGRGEFDFLSPEVVDDPYPFFAWLLAEAPVYEVPGTGVFLVSKGRLFETVLEREEDFSANLTGVLFTSFSRAAATSSSTRRTCPRWVSSIFVRRHSELQLRIRR